jgi:hypothetical protein
MVGDSSEVGFGELIGLLGFKILRRNNFKPPFDYIAQFTGEPTPAVQSGSKLLVPSFCPPDVSGFSVKGGDISKNDVETASDWLAEARTSGDAVVRSVAGIVIVTSQYKTNDEIESILSSGVYCWDIRRLLFYSIKARLVRELGKLGPVIEHGINMPHGSFFIHPPSAQSDVMMVNVNVFLEDPRLILHGDHLATILQDIYCTSLKRIVESTWYDIQARVTVHAMGVGDFNVLEKIFWSYAREKDAHPKVFFPVDGFKFVPYTGAPYASVFRT